MRPEKLYLIDMVEAAEAIDRFLAGMDREEFEIDDLRQSAILQKLTIIGEAAARLPVEFRDSHEQIEWRDIIAFRNIAIHEYFAVDWSIVWVAPKLRAQVESILADEFVEQDSRGPKND